MRPLWLTVIAATILCAPHREAFAQAPTHPVTTRSGVFSREQAIRGEDVYAGNCKSCHTPESQTGAMFDATWNGRALSELYGFIRERMPKNAPGSLTRQEYADVIAYMLRLNQMPEGERELQSDSTALKTIRIVTTIPVRKDR